MPGLLPIGGRMRRNPARAGEMDGKVEDDGRNERTCECSHRQPAPGCRPAMSTANGGVDDAEHEAKRHADWHHPSEGSQQALLDLNVLGRREIADDWMDEGIGTELGASDKPSERQRDEVQHRGGTHLKSPARRGSEPAFGLLPRRQPSRPEVASRLLALRMNASPRSAP